MNLPRLTAFFRLALPLALLAPSFLLRAASVTETYTFNLTSPGAGDIDDYQDPPKIFLQAITNSKILYLTKVEVRLKLIGHPSGSGFASEMFVSLNRDFDKSAVLLNRVGVTQDNSLGFFHDGWDVTFADDAAADIHEADTNDGSGILSGTYQPDGRTLSTDTQRPQILAGFNNLRGNGDWRLAVADLEPGGTMRLENWELVLTGEAAPEIQVEQPLGVILIDEVGSIAYGNVSLGNSSGAKTFTIRNIGTEDLTGIAISKDGMQSGDFTLNTSDLNATLAPGGSTTFSVTFAPSATDTRMAAVHIASNDADENPFDIALTGVGRTIAQAWRFQYFGSYEETETSADGANPDGDSLNNLQERAFGTKPTEPQSNVVSYNGNVITPGSPTVLIINQEFGVDYRALYSRRKDYVAAGLRYIVQFSADLSAWFDGTAAPAVMAHNGMLEAVSVKFPLSINGRKPQFFRVVVTQQSE